MGRLAKITQHPAVKRRERLTNGLLVGIFFLGVGLFLLRKIVFSSGMVAGGDWSTPITRLQFDTYGKNGLFLWTHVQNVFGVAQPYLTTLTNGMLFVVSRFVDGPVVDRLLLLFLYTFAGSSIYAFARFLGINPIPALVAGTLYIATPVFFDYTAMGWIFVLLAFSLIPWILIVWHRCLKEGGWLPALGLALLFAVGFSLSVQCIVWYPLAMMVLTPFVIRSWDDVWRGLWTLIVCGMVFVLLNLPWFLPLTRYGDTLLSSAASQRTFLYGQNVNLTNLLRGWASLFNYQFETAYPNILAPLTFLPAVVGFGLLLARPASWRVWFLAALSLIPVGLYFLPEEFYKLPFTVVTEELSRYVLFQALGSSLLAAMALQVILSLRPWQRIQWAKHVPKFLGVGLVALLLLNGYPTWTGELTNASKEGLDIRLRTLTLPQEYTTIEQQLAQFNGSGKALYFPAGMFVNLTGDSRFFGTYREFNDSYASYAPRPGGIFIGDRRAGDYHDVADFISKSHFLTSSSKPSQILATLGIRWIVVRRQLQGHEYATLSLLHRLQSDPALVKRQDSDIVLYENSIALPLVYASTAPSFQNISVSDGLPNTFADGFVEQHHVAFFNDRSHQMGDTQQLIRDIATVNAKQPLPSITFQKINSTRFDIRVDHAQAPFFLVLSETFDPRWHLEPSPDTHLVASSKGNVTEAPARDDFVWTDATLTERDSLAQSTHFQANGFANSWYIVPPVGQSTMTLRAEFASQPLSYVGFIIAILTLLAIASFFLLQFRGRIIDFAMRRLRKSPHARVDPTSQTTPHRK